MEGKTLFLKFNTGPSGHGMPPAAGEALALKLAGADEVKVFVVEGEGGLTPGASHETRNTAWGLGLVQPRVPDRLERLRHRRAPAVGRRLRHAGRLVRALRLARHRHRARARSGAPVTRAVLEGRAAPTPASVPSMAWFRTRKGRGYGKYDAHQPRHAAPDERARVLDRAQGVHGPKYGIKYAGRRRAGAGRCRPARCPGDARTSRPRFGVLRERRRRCVDWLIGPTASRLPPPCRSRSRASRSPRPRRGSLRRQAALRLPRTTRPSCGSSPATSSPTAPRLGNWGAWVNSYAKAEYGRPLFIGASADLAESTNIAGFGKDFGDLPGWGWYERDSNPRGTRPADRDHRVHQRRPDGRHGHGQHGRRPVRGLQRLLGHVLDLRLVHLSEVRPDAPVLASWRRTAS